MKVAVIAGIWIALAFGCSIDKRSGEYACTMTANCDSGRVCLDGFCVVAGDGGIGDPDSGTPPADATHPIDAPATTCPSACTSCDVDGKTCEIDCASTSCSQVTCPAGYKCTIDCTTYDACGMGVDCTQSAGCTITCSGSASCGDVECGSAACDISCTGRRSCPTVNCGESCACDLTCGGQSGCSALDMGNTGDSVTCSHGGECTGGGGSTGLGERCTSSTTGCDTCP